MPSAVAFFPLNIKVFVNLETSLSLYLGSGMIRRLGTSRRRGIGFSRGSRGVSGGLCPPDHALGRLTPYLERLRLRLTLLVDDGPIAPEASSVPRTTW